MKKDLLRRQSLVKKEMGNEMVLARSVSSCFPPFRNKIESHVDGADEADDGGQANKESRTEELMN